LLPPRDISAGCYHHGISLLVVTTTGYLCWLLPPRDISAGFYHHGISLLVVTTTGYPCWLLAPRDIDYRINLIPRSA